MTAAVDATDAGRRRDCIKALLTDMLVTKETVLALITEAKDSNDHVALGYRSWTEYVATDFAALLADLNREDRREAVLTLAQTGMSTRAIAPIVGTSHMAVKRDLDGGVTQRYTSPEPAPAVVGVDGKSYLRAVPAKPSPRRRRPLPDSFWDATHKLGKITTTLETLHKDDRFATNRGTVRRHRADLQRAQLILRRLIADLGDDDQAALL